MKHLSMPFAFAVCALLASPVAGDAQGLTVDESTGLVRYDYQLDLPQARGRYQPRLGLVSSSGDWLAYPLGCQFHNTGVGATWSLNLPAIRHDGGGSNAALTYYQPGRGVALKSTLRDGSSLVAEVEVGYLKVTRSDTTTLVAVDATGNTMTFKTANPSSAAYPYLLKSVQDPDGNVTAYTWLDGAGAKLGRIDYNAFLAGAADKSNTSTVGDTGNWGTSILLSWTTFNGGSVLDTIQVSVKSVPGAVNPSTGKIEPIAAIARQYQMTYGATANYPNSGAANDTSLVSITESGPAGSTGNLVTTFDRTPEGCIRSVTSPLGAKQEVYYLSAVSFGVPAASYYPVAKTMTISGPALASSIIEYWYGGPKTVGTEYRGFLTSTMQDSATSIVRQTTWNQGSKPFVGSAAAVKEGTISTLGSTYTPPSIAAFRTTTFTRAAKSIGSANCTDSTTEAPAGDYPVIPVVTSVLDQRVVDLVTLGSKRSTTCSKVDAWGNAGEVVLDPDTSYTGDELTTTTTYVVTTSPSAVCKDCVKSRAAGIGTSSTLDRTEITYDAAGRVQQVQRQALATQGVSQFPVVAAYTYDGNGNLATRTEGGTTYAFSYDDWFQARVAKVSAVDVMRPTGKKLVTEMVYDEAGRPAHVLGPYYVAADYPASLVPHRYLAYDGLGRIIAVARQPFSGVAVVGGLAAFSYQPFDPALPTVPASVTTYQFAVAKGFSLGAPPATGDARQVTTFLDGLGRAIQTRERLGGAGADPASSIVEALLTASGSNYLVSGTVLLDGAGRTRATLAPYFSASGSYRDPGSASYAAGSEAVKGPVQATWFQRDTQGRVTCSTVRVVTGMLSASGPGSCASSFLEDGTYARATKTIYRGTTLDGRSVLGVKTVEPRFTATTDYASVGSEVFVDAAGNVRRVQDAEGNRINYLFDALGRATGTSREAPGSTRATIISSVALDMMGRVSARTDPNTGGRTFTYDATTPGLLASVKFNKSNEEIRYGYDLGRLAKVESCDGLGWCSTDSDLKWDVPYTGPVAAAYQYTAGRVGYATSAQTTVALSYDDGGTLQRRDQWVAGDARFFSFAAGRREDGKATSWAFSANSGFGLPDVSMQLGYDSAGHTVQAWEGGRLLWQSVSGSDGTGSYDAWGRIGSVQVDEGRASQTWTYAGSSGLQASQTVTIQGAANPVVYNVNAMTWRGTQLISWQDQVAKTTTSYWYSQAGRLVASQVKDNATASQLGLTCVGFNTSKEYKPGPSFGDIEVVTQSGGTASTATYAYTSTDADGGTNAGPDAPTSVGQANLAYGYFGRIGSKGTGETFGYDRMGRLISVTRTIGASEYIAYDPFGQLLWRKVGTAESWYLGKHATVTGLGGSVAVDLHLEVNGGRVASVRVGASPRTLYLHRDRLTSVVETSLSGGVPGASYRYGAHGALTSASGDAGAAESELGYAGAVRLTGGLLLMGARVYDPALKIFLQPDPLAPHSYTYAGGDPINRWDPTGLEDLEVDPATAKKKEDKSKAPPGSYDNPEPMEEVVVIRDKPQSGTRQNSIGPATYTSATISTGGRSGAGGGGGVGGGRAGKTSASCPPGQVSGVQPRTTADDLWLGVSMTGNIVGLQTGFVAATLGILAATPVGVVAAIGGVIGMAFAGNGLVKDFNTAAGIGQSECFIEDPR